MDGESGNEVVTCSQLVSCEVSSGVRNSDWNTYACEENAMISRRVGIKKSASTGNRNEIILV